MTEARRNGSVRAAQGLTTSGAMNEAKLEQLNEPGFKKLRSCVGKDGGETKQTLLFFQLKFALAHGHTIIIYFTHWNEVPGAIVCRGHKQKVRSTPLQPCGMPEDAKPCAVGCIRGDSLQWVVYS